MFKSLLTGACLLAVLAGCASAPQKHADTSGLRAQRASPAARESRLARESARRWGNPIPAMSCARRVKSTRVRPCGWWTL